MDIFDRVPVPLAQAYELDANSSICEGLVSYIACLPAMGGVPREFHPNGKNRAFTRAGTTGTELRARTSTATLRGQYSAHPMATVSTGSSDRWSLSYGSSSILDGAKPVCLLSLGYCNVSSTTAKRMVRYEDSGGNTSASFQHGNGTVSDVFGVFQVTGSLFSQAAMSAVSAGVDSIAAFEYTPGAGTQTLYLNGVVTTPTSSVAQTNNVVGPTSVVIGNNSGGTLPFNGGVGVVALWNRTLSAAEHAALALDPYLPLRKSRMRRIFIPAAAAGNTYPQLERLPVRGLLRGVAR